MLNETFSVIFKHRAKIVNGKTFFKAKDNLLTKLFFRCHDRGKTKENQESMDGWLPMVLLVRW